jgi:hypothetical protein
MSQKPGSVSTPRLLGTLAVMGATRSPKRSANRWREAIAQFRSALACGVVVCVLSTVAVVVSATSAAADPAAPPQAFSFYMQTTNTSTLETLGTEFGSDAVSGSVPAVTLVVLDWGEPDKEGTTNGTIDFAGNFDSVGSEEAATEAFATGYWLAAFNANDFSVNSYIAMGLDNYGSFFEDSSDSYSNATNFGTEWGTVVNIVNAYMNNEQQYGEYPQLTIARASMKVIPGNNESAPDGDGYAAPEPTFNWAWAFANNTNVPYWDDGNAMGCPASGGDGDCDYGWTTAGIANISDQIYAVVGPNAGTYYSEPLPEVYSSDEASQWGNLDSSDSDYGIMFLGSLDQHQYCVDIDSSCSGSDDTANESWDALYDALNCGAECAQPQTPPHLASIRWDLNEPT